MSQYMLLLYADEADEAEQARRWADMPRWEAIVESLSEAGVLVANNPLHSVDTATTVRLRDTETQLTDGPFAATKEVLAGYFLLECEDLDEALRHAGRLPTAEYGSVEVRPVVSAADIPRPGEAPAREG